jgi:hypothetical protein
LSQAGSEAKRTPKADKGKVKNLPFDEALDLSASDASLSRGPSEQRGGGGAKAVSNQRFDEALDVSASSMSDAKETPKARGAGGGGSAGFGGRAPVAGGGAKAERGVVKDKPFDEAHDIGDDDLSSDGSVETNESEPKQPVRNTGAQANHAAASAAVKSAQGAGHMPAVNSLFLVTSHLLTSAQPKGPIQGKGSDSKPPGTSAAPPGTGDESSSEGSGSSEEDDDDDEPAAAGGAAKPGTTASTKTTATAAAPLPGAYNPNDFKHLPVSSEVTHGYFMNTFSFFVHLAALLLRQWTSGERPVQLHSEVQAT